MNEIPYALQVTAENSPLSYENDKPKVRENANRKPLFYFMSNLYSNIPFINHNFFGSLFSLFYC